MSFTCVKVIPDFKSLLVAAAVGNMVSTLSSLSPAIRNHGSYMQGYVKFKDFSRTSKNLYYSFQGLIVNENTDQSIKSLLQKC